MSLSMLERIDKVHPEAEITWVCGKIIEPVLRQVKRINHLIVIDEKKLLRGNLIERLTVLSILWGALFFKKYDLVVNGHSDRRYNLLHLTVRKDKYRKYIQNEGRAIIPGRYYAADYAKLIDDVDDFQMTPAVFPKLMVDCPEKEVILGKMKGKKVILNPAGAKNLLNGGEVRRWPIEYYVTLAEELLRSNVNVIIVGNDNDKWIDEYFKHLNVWNLTGDSNLLDLICLYNNCDLFITHDTGPYHLAKLTEIKILALFGPTLPYSFYNHPDKQVWALWKGDELTCSPCYNGKSFAACSNNICMKNITAREVISTAKSILKIV